MVRFLPLKLIFTISLLSFQILEFRLLFLEPKFARYQSFEVLYGIIGAFSRFFPLFCFTPLSIIPLLLVPYLSLTSFNSIPRVISTFTSFVAVSTQFPLIDEVLIIVTLKLFIKRLVYPCTFSTHLWGSIWVLFFISL
jgi:hypothetical protein